MLSDVMKKLFYLFSLALLLASCVQQKEVIKEPSVLKMVPEASVGESWRAHDIKIMVVCDLDADVELVDTPWALVTGSEVTGSGQTTVTIRVEANDGEQARKGMVVATCGKSSTVATFTQNALGSTLGIWNYDGKGGDIPFEPLKFQTSVRRYSDGTVVSRLLDPVGQKFLAVKGLPAKPTPGTKTTLTLIQNWMDAVSVESEREIEIVKTGDGKIWLSDGDAVYVLKF